MPTFTKTITEYDDIIDVRDVIDRFEELQGGLTGRHAEGGVMSSFDDWIVNSRDDSEPIHAQWPDGGIDIQHDIEEFYDLRELLSNLRGLGGDEMWEGDWYPLTLIRESHFEDYARELAEDCGMVNKNQNWPNNCIDWASAARGLQRDYTQVDFRRNTYYTR